MIHVSIVVGEQITNIFNLRDIVAYAKERNVVCEIVKTTKDAKGKYIFLYNTTTYYIDYYVHWSFLRMEMPIGYESDDIDLPEKLYWDLALVCDGKDVGARVDDQCDFFLRIRNGFKTSIREGGIYGKCTFGNVEKPMYFEETLKNQIVSFFRSEK